MNLSDILIKEFVKVTAPPKTEKKETTLYGTVSKNETAIYVKIDGSDILTPVTTTSAVKNGDRVTVMIKNHTAIITGNITDPSASDSVVGDISDKIGEYDTILAEVVTTDELNAQIARIDQLIAEDVIIKGDLEASNAKIDQLEANNVIINGELDAVKAKIDSIESTTITTEFLEANYAKIKDLEATNIKVNNLEATFGSFEELTTTELTAIKATIQELDAEKISAEEADLKYATIDFANIGTAAIENFFSKSGMIGDLVVGDGTVTGELIGVTIRGDNIIAGTIQADKLVIKGEDGLYYSLNVNGETVEAQQTNQNALDGSHIIAKSIAATKISVKDLVAFDATIGGYNITDEALYSGVKSSIDNTTVGVYLDSTGQINIGDQNNFLKYYKDSSSGQYKLEISADSFVFSSSGENIEDKLDSISSGYSVFMSKENHTFEGDTDSVSETQTVKSLIKAMYGNEVVDCTVEKITTPTGLTIVSDNAKPSPTLTITATTGLTTAGTVIIPITIQNKDGKTIEITKMFSYSIAYKGQNGAQGEPGKPGSDGTGVTIKSTSITYQVGTNGTTPPTGTWLSTIPTVNPGQYLWTRTIVTYSDDKSTTSYSVSRNGTNGATGSPGVSITKTEVFYYLSTSNTTQTGGSWVTTPPAWVDGKYYWQKIKTTFSDDKTSESTPVCITGGKGQNGTNGSPGSPGQSVTSIVAEYYLSTSKTTQTGGSWVTTMPAWSSGKYLWIRNKITYANPAKTEYTKPYCDSSWEAVNDIEVGGRNLIIRSTETKDKYIGIDGSITTSVNFSLSDYISILPNQKYMFTKNTGTKTGSDQYFRYAWYSKDKTYLGRAPNISNEFMWISPSDAYYIRISYPTDCNVKFEKGNKATDWTPAPEDVDADINDAAKTATNFLSYDSTNGLLIGNKTGGSWTGYRTQITASAFNILDASGKQLASYGASLIELGKNATTSKISLCAGKGTIQYAKSTTPNDQSTYLEFVAENIRLKGSGRSVILHENPGKTISSASFSPSTADIVCSFTDNGQSWYSSSISIDPRDIYINAKNNLTILSGGKMEISTVAGADMDIQCMGSLRIISSASIDLRPGGSLTVNGLGILYRKSNLGGGVNLNNIQATGFYSQPADADAQSGSNYPIQRAGVLVVYWCDSFIYQYYHCYADNGIYVRNYYKWNNTWYPWKRLDIDDTGWQNCWLQSGFSNYNTDGSCPLQIRKINGVVHLRGQVRRHGAIKPSGESSTPIAQMPGGFAPVYRQNYLCQGSGASKFLLNINPNGYIYISRYNSSSTTNMQIPDQAWLNCFATWFIG